MLIDVTHETFKEFLPLDKPRGIYIEDAEQFTLLQSLDNMTLRAIVSKEALYIKMRTAYEDEAMKAAADAGLQVDKEPELPDEEEIRKTAYEKFRREELQLLKEGLAISKPEINVRL